VSVFTIHKDEHRALPLYWLKWWPLFLYPTRITRQVQFRFDSKYDLQGYDQHNKLFGLAFGSVHKHSARFGWRYDNKRSVFVLSAYCYVDGERIVQDLCDTVANHKYQCELWISLDHYWFKVINEKGQEIANEKIEKAHRRRFAWLLGLFFGGAFAAPETIKIELK
jgi:hypothetical protein